MGQRVVERLEREQDADRLADPQADADMGWAVALVEAVRSARAEMNISPGAQLPLVAVGSTANETALAATRSASALASSATSRLLAVEVLTMPIPSAGSPLLR